MSPNRIVALLTPVFAGLAGYITTWIAQHFPGAPKLDKAELTAVFVLGGGAAIGAALKWLHGWQKHESKIDSDPHALTEREKAIVAAAPPVGEEELDHLPAEDDPSPKRKPRKKAPARKRKPTRRRR